MNLDDPLQRAARVDFEAYDPRPVIDAVNALWPLGAEGALVAIEAFVAAHDADPDAPRGLFLVLRVLFEADPHPPMRLGSPLPPAPPDATALPRFPIALVDDVPLLLVTGYLLRGLPEPVSAHVAHYRAHGTLRAAPLAPAAGPDRLAGYARVYAAAYGAPPPDAERARIQAQLDRLKP